MYLLEAQCVCGTRKTFSLYPLRLTWEADKIPSSLRRYKDTLVSTEKVVFRVNTYTFNESTKSYEVIQ